SISTLFPYTTLFRSRVRKRISNGISVNTIPDDDHVQEFERIAAVINSNIKFRGAWFYQVKENNEGQLCLLEVASRLGGSSSLFRSEEHTSELQSREN